MTTVDCSSSPSSSDERDLVARASRGDAGAFSQLVRNHSGLVYRVAMRMMGANEAQDASQEAWVKAWRNIKNFRGESAFSTWMYKVTVNTCLSFRQKVARRDDREVRGEFPYIFEASGVDNDPEVAALSQERKGEVHDALQRVREDHRAALVLRHMEGLSYAEIAEVLEVPDGTAKGWVSRGRAALLVALDEQSREKQGAGAEEEAGEE